MSYTSDNKNKLPFELVSNLLTKLLDSKLSKLEAKNRDEMNNILIISQNSKIIIKELQNINQKIKAKRITNKKIINVYNPLNINNKKNNKKISTQLNNTITYKKTQLTPDSKYHSKRKKETKNNIKKLKLNKSAIFTNDLLINKSHTSSKIISHTRRGSKVYKKTKSKKKNRDMTPTPPTPSSLYRKKIKGKEKSKYSHNNNSVLKHTNTCTDFYNNKSCELIPFIKKDKLNLSKLSKNDELDNLYSAIDDKRIYDLNPDLSKNISNKEKNKNKKITSTLFRRRGTVDFINKRDENRDLSLEDSILNYVKNDDLLIINHNKRTMGLIDDITLSKSFLGDEPDCDLDLEINSERSHNLTNLSNLNNIKNNNYTLAERFENCIEFLIKYLTKDEFLKIGLINKECFKMIMNYLISKKEDTIDDVKEALSNLKNNYSDIIDQNDYNNNFTLKPFECNIHSCRAISLLNSIPIENIFDNVKSEDLKNNNILLMFDLFFIALGYKKTIISFKDDIKSKWNFYKNFFDKNNNQFFGDSIENKIKGKIFDNEIINSLYEYSKDYINIITPSYFQKINNDIALFVFIVKNILEHVGITKDVNNKKNVIKLYLLYNARIYMNSIILQKLNKINTIINNKK